MGNINTLPDKKLHDLLYDIKIVTKDKLFSKERFGAIIRLNNGSYAKLDLGDYVDPNKWILTTTKEKIIQLDNWKNELKWDFSPHYKDRNFINFNSNLKILVRSPKFSNMLKIGLDASNKYEIYVNEELQFVVDPCCEFEHKNENYILDPPKFVESIEIREVNKYYDTIWIYNRLTKLKIY